MKVGIAGTGAVGGYVGGMLSLAGHDVVFLTRGKSFEYLRNFGLVIETENETKKVQGHFTNKIEDLSAVDLLVFTVKGNDTKEVAAKIQPIIKKETVILTLQNGVDNEETLSDIFGYDRVLSAAAYIQVHIKEVGVVKQIGGTPLFLIGSLDINKNEEFLKELHSFFNIANLKTHISSNIMEVKWKKLLWNVTFNPLSALIEKKVGVILENKDLLGIAREICMESISVAKSLGLTIEEDTVENVISQAQQARDHQTSMLQDKLKGKEMELESICGYIVNKGKHEKVPTPVLETIYRLLKFSQEKTN